MKNLKIVLSLLLAMTMIVGCMATAFAASIPSDVVGTRYETAARMLANLNIMIGDENGFRPEDAITRAEVAKIVVAATGIENVVQADTRFSDVSSSHWASGYIKYAEAQGIVKGTSATEFTPDANVTNEQIITMIVRTLGYEPAAMQSGGYPTGYYVIANQERLFKDVDNADIATGGTAKRGVVAQILANALDTPIMIQQFVNSNTYVKTGTVSGIPEQTLLDTRLRLEKYNVEVSKVYDANTVDLRVLGRYEDEENAQRFDNGNSRPANHTYNLGSRISRVNTLEGMNLSNMRGAILTVWLRVEADRDIKTLVTYREKSTVYYDFISEVDGKNVARYVNPNSTSNINSTDITLHNANVNLNLSWATGDTQTVVYDYSDPSSKKDTITSMSKAADLLNQYAKIVVRQNGEVASIYRLSSSNNYYHGGVIESVTDTSIYFNRQTDFTSTRRLADIDTKVKIDVIINGKIADYSDLKEGMMFDYYDYEDNEALSTSSIKRSLVILASDVVAEGRLSTKTREVIIGGTSYITILPNVTGNGGSTASADKFSDNQFKAYYSEDGGLTYNYLLPTEDTGNSLDALLGTDVFAYVDMAGYPRYIKSTGDDSGAFYAYIYRAWEGQSDSVRLFRANSDGTGEHLTYEVAISKSSTTSKSFSDIKNAVAAVQATDGTGDFTNRRFGIFKVTVNSDGKISKALAVDGTGNEYVGNYVTSRNVTVGTTPTTVLYNDLNAGVNNFELEFSSDDRSFVIFDDDDNSYGVVAFNSNIIFDLSGKAHDEPEVVTWQALGNRTIKANNNIRLFPVLETGKSSYSALVFTDNFTRISGSTKYHAYIISSERLNSEHTLLSLMTADGYREEFRVKTDDYSSGTLKAGTLIEYTLSTDDTIKIQAYTPSSSISSLRNGTPNVTISSFLGLTSSGDYDDSVLVGVTSAVYDVKGNTIVLSDTNVGGVGLRLYSYDKNGSYGNHVSLSIKEALSTNNALVVRVNRDGDLSISDIGSIRTELGDGTNKGSRAVVYIDKDTRRVKSIFYYRD